jgi:hypothetical protein
MSDQSPQGTIAWFDLVGAEIVKAAARIGLPRNLRLSVIERYVDGVALHDGLYQGLRIDVADGALICRAGVRPEENADVVIEVTTLAARRLNLLPSSDPEFHRALADAVAQGELRINGDLGPLEPVFDLAHDDIVRRTI